jgi:hypothetical protein
MNNLELIARSIKNLRAKRAGRKAEMDRDRLHRRISE